MIYKITRLRLLRTSRDKFREVRVRVRVLLLGLLLLARLLALSRLLLGRLRPGRRRSGRRRHRGEGKTEEVAAIGTPSASNDSSLLHREDAKALEGKAAKMGEGE